jgi:F420-dependent oxidoreductase-like protein
MRIALMIEGQEDVSWEEWLALAHACERWGIEALFRSDHYLSVDGRRRRGSLDAWTTIAALAASTTRLRLGTLVSPATFRHPSLLAKAVVTADHVSGGRVELGIGTGWLEAEHAAYGFPFPPLRERMDVLAEQLEILRGAWREGPFDFAGRHYRVAGLDALPKPLQRPHPPLIMGGDAGPRSARLAARWADEYNTVYAGVEEAAARRARIVEACERAGRPSLPFSVMTGVLIGADRADLDERARRLSDWRGEQVDPAALAGTWIVGTVEEAAARLREYEGAGVERVMLQHLLHRDLDAVELIGRELAPAVG